jgi:hypothetical protein
LYLARLKDAAGLWSFACFKTLLRYEEDHGIIKEAKPDTFFQAVGEILPMRARHPYITPPFFCRRECRLCAEIIRYAFAVNLN